jgi:hypothetical protein
MFAWFVLTLCCAALLMLGVNRLLARLGVTKEQPDERGGLADIAARLERWAEERRRG